MRWEFVRESVYNMFVGLCFAVTRIDMEITPLKRSLISSPINSLCTLVVFFFVPTLCVACFLVGAQSIVQRFDSFLFPVDQLHSVFSLFHPDSFSVESVSRDRAHFVAWLKPSVLGDQLLTFQPCRYMHT